MQLLMHKETPARVRQDPRCAAWSHLSQNTIPFQSSSTPFNTQVNTDAFHSYK